MCLYHCHRWSIVTSTRGPRGISWVVPHGITWGCHMSHFYWPIWWPKVPNQHATWHVVIGPCQHVDIMPLTATVLPHHLPHPVWIPHHLPCGCMDATCHLPCGVRCHMVVRTAMWHFLIGPHVDLKMPKMSDTWQPLVLATS
jgi:hypothetical protein